MQMYRREHYLAKLRPFYDDAGLIKVVTAFAVVEIESAVQRHG